MKRLCMGCMEEYDDRYSVCPHCGYEYNTPPEQAYHMMPGSILANRYVVGKVLGFGGFGVTYIGWDFLMERKVAIKEYLPSEFATRIPTQEKVTVYSGDKEQGFQEGLKKTLDEARRLAKFGDVNGIVQIYDCLEANGTSYIIMEYLEGVTLNQYLKDHGPMEPSQALPVILQLTEAMEAVHRTGILHRDIAPDNIRVLNPDEPDRLIVKLFDFGAARYAMTKHSKSLSVIVKQGYAPEEQYSSGGDQGTWSDVYALAATLYTMLTGLVPEDALERSAKDELKKPSKLGVDLPKPMETALMNALRVKAQNRTPTMADFTRELMAADVDPHPEDKHSSGSLRLPRWLLLLAGGGVAAAGVVIALLLVGVIRPSSEPRPEQYALERGSVRVPNVVNYSVDRAEEVAGWYRLELVCDRAEFSDEIPENQISYQEIKEGTVVDRYSPLVVYVSKGQRMGILPFVQGLSMEDAKEKLADAGFANIEIQESQEPGDYQSVLAVSEEQGANVSLSRKIVVTVCMNRDSERAADSGRSAQVPRVLGLTREDAEQELAKTGFKVSWITDFSEEPEGTVFKQEPGAGTEAGTGSYIKVFVSTGPQKIYMESLMLTTEQEAKDRIVALGLTVGQIRKQYSDTVPAGQVISQSVGNGQEVRKGEAISLVISSGKDPVKAAQEKAAREQEERMLASAGADANLAASIEESQRQADARAASLAESQRQAEEEARRQSEAESQRQAEEEARRQSEAESQQQAEAEAQQQTETSQSVVVSGVISQPSQAADHPGGEEAAAQPSQASAEPGGSQVLEASGERTVSKKVKMDNVKGMTLDDARAAIQDQGLTVGSISYQASDKVEAGCVIFQSVSSGKSVERGQQVNLVVSSGPGQ